MTPAEQNLLAHIEALKGEIGELRRAFADVIDLLPVPEELTIPQIAARRACSPSWLRAKPWRLPDFGQGTTAESGRRRFARDAVGRWYAGDDWERERKADWERMTPAERRRCMS